MSLLKTECVLPFPLSFLCILVYAPAAKATLLLLLENPWLWRVRKTPCYEGHRRNLQCFFGALVGITDLDITNSRRRKMQILLPLYKIIQHNRKLRNLKGEAWFIREDVGIFSFHSPSCAFLMCTAVSSFSLFELLSLLHKSPDFFFLLKSLLQLAVSY